ncbi:MAG TPA: ScyD/ScyE family protein [Bryobacteraceae bacterium]|nr:ScyD/ScyE family protein [Bryobacteraceae bacterium]
MNAAYPMKYSSRLVLALLTAGLAFPQSLPPLSSNALVFASGLNNPRGIKFGPDGALYVAEGGTGGTLSTAGMCTQVVPPVGPYTGGMTGRISKIDNSGNRTTVVSGLPSSQTSSTQGSLVSGVADIAFVGTTMYAVLGGAGCSHGLANTVNSVIQVNTSQGTWTQLADLSTFLASNPVANPSSDDYEPDGTFYSLISLGNKLFTVEPNHGEIDEINLNGNIKRVVDISDSHGHIVPTALAYSRDQLYFGNLFLFPVEQGSANIFTYGTDKRIHVVVPQLTTVVGIAFDNQNRLYVLEMSAGQGGPGPGQGMVLRVEYNGHLTTVASGFTFPTSMTFAPDGTTLYVTNLGFGFPAGAGQVVRVTVPN